MDRQSGNVGDPDFLKRFKPELLRRIPQSKVHYSCEFLEQWWIEHLLVTFTRPSGTSTLTIAVWDVREVMGPGRYGPPCIERITKEQFDTAAANAMDTIEKWLRELLDKPVPHATP